MSELVLDSQTSQVELDAKTLKRVTAAVREIKKGGVEVARAKLVPASSAEAHLDDLLILAEAAADSATVATHLLDAECVAVLLPYLTPVAPKHAIEATLRLFSAISAHPTGSSCERLLKGGLLPPLLALLPTATDALAVRIAVLICNLAADVRHPPPRSHPRGLPLPCHPRAVG